MYIFDIQCNSIDLFSVPDNRLITYMDFKNKIKFFFKKSVKDLISLMTQNFTSILYWDFCGCVFQTEMKMSFSTYKCNQSANMEM